MLATTKEGKSLNVNVANADIESLNYHLQIKSICASA